MMTQEPFSISFVPDAIRRLGCPGGWTPDTALDVLMRFAMLWLDCAFVQHGKRRCTTSLFAMSVGKDKEVDPETWQGPFQAQGKTVDWLDGVFCKYLPATIINDSATLSTLQNESDRAGGVLRIFSPFECSLIGSRSFAEMQKFIDSRPSCIWARWQNPLTVSKACERVYRGYSDLLEQCSLIIDNRAIHERTKGSELDKTAVDDLVQFALERFMALEPPCYGLTDGAAALLTNAARHWGHPASQPRFAKGFRAWCKNLAPGCMSLSLVFAMLDQEKSDLFVHEEHMHMAIRWHLLAENQAWSLFEEASIRDAITRQERKHGGVS